MFLLICLPARLSTASPSNSEATTRPLEQASTPSPEDRAAQQLLNRHIQVRLIDSSLSDSLNFFVDLTGSSIVVDWPALHFAGVTEKDKIHLEDQNMPFGDALNAVLIQAAGTQKPAYRIEDGAIMVSTPTELDRFDLFNAYEAKKLRELQIAPASDLSRHHELKCLNKTLRSVQLNAVPLTDAIDLMKDLGPLNIIVDWKALKVAGIDMHAPVTVVTDNLTTALDLQLILYQAGSGAIAFGDEDGVIFISTKENLDKIRPASTNQPSSP